MSWRRATFPGLLVRLHIHSFQEIVMTSVFATPLSGSGMVLAVLCAGLLGACASTPAGPADARPPVSAALGVTSEQRLHTEGGNAPARGCSAQADAGKRIKEGCAADHVFFAATFP